MHSELDEAGTDATGSVKNGIGKNRQHVPWRDHTLRLNNMHRVGRYAIGSAEGGGLGPCGCRWRGSRIEGLTGRGFEGTWA